MQERVPNRHQPKVPHTVTLSRSERSVVLGVETLCMDYSHRHPESVGTSYPTAIRFSVSGSGPGHQCVDTMCWPCPGDDVGNPYRSVVLGVAMLRCGSA